MHHFPTSLWLVTARWPSGFRCPACGGAKGWPHGGKPFTFECAACGKQTSVTAGTIMHGSKLPWIVWFWAVYLMATHSNGISVLQLQKQLGLGSYKSAWLLCAKLRRAMVAPGRAPLAGLIEVDEAEIPLRTKADPVCGGGGRSTQGKMFVAGAVEVENDAPGRLRLAAIKDFSAASLHGFVAANIAPGATIKTDGWPSYARAPDARHEPHVVGAMAAHVCPGSTAPSPTPRPGRSASITDCEDSISRATSTNSSSASTDAEPATPPSIPFSQTPRRQTANLQNVDLAGS